MKKFGVIVLTIYLTLTTLGSGLFGFLYFSNKTNEQKMSQENATSLVTAVWEDLKECASRIFGTGMASGNALDYQDYDGEDFGYSSGGGLNNAIYMLESYKNFISTHTAEVAYYSNDFGETGGYEIIELSKDGAIYHGFESDRFEATSIKVRGDEDNWVLDMGWKHSGHQTTGEPTSPAFYFQTNWHYEKKNGKVFRGTYSFLEVWDIEPEAIQDGRYDKTRDVKTISGINEYAVAIMDYDLNAHKSLEAMWIGPDFGDDSIILTFSELSDDDALEVANMIIDATKFVKTSL